jgi:glycolate oxidase iron-sulfur subunit
MKKEVLEDIEKCVRCGSCKAVCPTFTHTGVEPLSARGRMVLLHEYNAGRLKPSKLLNERLYSCTLCGICEGACPARVKVTDAIYEGRHELVRSDKRRRLMRTGAKLSIKNPNLSFRTLKLAMAVSGKLIPGMLERADFPFRVSLPDRPLRSGEKIYKPEGKARGRAALFTGCSVNYLYPQLGRSLIQVLLASGMEVVLPPGEVCCGEPLRALGLEEEAEKLARRNFDVFGRLRADAVISLCPTCTLAIKVHYPSIIGKGIDNAMDVTQFLGDEVEPIAPPAEGEVSYHNPCHLGSALGVKKEPLTVLRSLGHNVIGSTDSECCGFSISLWDKEVSDSLLEGTLKKFDESKPLVTACPGCMMQLGRKHPNVRHIVELIEEGVVRGKRSATQAA